MASNLRPISCPYDSRYGRGQANPVLSFIHKLPVAEFGKRVILGLAVILRGLPGSRDPALIFQPVQRWVKRSLIDLEHVFGNLLDALRDAPAMHRLQFQRLEDQQIERAL